jgi:hypothetical protein
MAKPQVLSSQRGFDRLPARASVELEPAGQIPGRTSLCLGPSGRIERSEVQAPGGHHPARGLSLNLDQIVLACEGGCADRNWVLGSFRDARRASWRFGSGARRRAASNQNEDTDYGGNFHDRPSRSRLVRRTASQKSGVRSRESGAHVIPTAPDPSAAEGLGMTYSRSPTHPEPLRPNVRSILICGNTVTERSAVGFGMAHIV